MTAYKFLDIKIVVEPTSHVEIAICDNRSNCIILPHATWKAFIERRVDIVRLMQSTAPSSSSPIQDLNVEFVKVYDRKNCHCMIHACTWCQQPYSSYLSSSNVSSNAHYKLSQCTHDVKEKFKYFCIIFKTKLYY